MFHHINCRYEALVTRDVTAAFCCLVSATGKRYYHCCGRYPEQSVNILQCVTAASHIIVFISFTQVTSSSLSRQMVKQSAALAAIMKVLWQPVYSRGALGSCFSSACMRFLEIMLFCLSLLRGVMLLVCVAGCVRTRLLLTLRCQVVTTGSLTLILLALNFPPLSVTHYWKSSVCHKHQSGGELSYSNSLHVLLGSWLKCLFEH